LERGVLDFIIGEDEHKFARPQAISTDERGNIWVADQGNRNIYRINRASADFEAILDNQEENFASLVGICQQDNQHLFLYRFK
jgi:streptogramin lyase